MPPAARYEDRGRLSEGGMGEVRRVFDRALGREVVQKLLLWDHLGDDALERRFEREIRIAAGLHHPGIPPVHDLGHDEAGRPWMTMREIRGRTLREILKEGARDLVALRRLVGWFTRAVEAVAYAHARGIIHRDLKPDNLMIGEFGEVQVIDWGLAREIASFEAEEGSSHPSMPGLTGAGEVLGTPGYLAPEVAAGAAAGLRSDVFALGVVLGQILQVAHDDLPRPADLTELAAACVLPDAEARPADATVLAARLNAWLDGSSRAEQAGRLVDEARGLATEADVHRRESRALRELAAKALNEAPTHVPISVEKQRAWRLEDEAAEHERRALVLSTIVVSRLEAALELTADHGEAHVLLAAHYRRELEVAESAHNVSMAIWAEQRLRQHDRGLHAAWLAGDGAVSLATQVPAEVSLFRYELDQRQLVPVRIRSLGTTPLRAAAVPWGSFLLVLRTGVGPDVRYPIALQRGEHWQAGPDDRPFSLWLPSELATDERYVPAGWFYAGGDEAAGDAVPARRLWLDGFVAAANPVTNEEYLYFIEQLQAHGEDVEEWLPRPTRAVGAEEAQSSLFVRDSSGRFGLPGDPGWGPRCPVTQITWYAARRYAQWKAQDTGLPWRLPHALEWEKMARGVDGRRWPWGDHEDPTWFCNLRAHPGKPTRMPVDAFPIDVSVYGVAGLAGNVRDWCANAWERTPSWPDGGRVDVLRAPEPGEIAEVRGGAWSNVPHFCRPAARYGNAPTDRLGSGGFRLVRSVG